MGLLFFFDPGGRRVALDRIDSGQATAFFRISFAGTGDVLAVTSLQTPAEFAGFVFVDFEAGRRFGLTVIGGAGRGGGEIRPISKGEAERGDGGQQKTSRMRHHGVLLASVQCACRMASGLTGDTKDVPEAGEQKVKSGMRRRMENGEWRCIESVIPKMYLSPF